MNNHQIIIIDGVAWRFSIRNAHKYLRVVEELSKVVRPELYGGVLMGCSVNLTPGNRNPGQIAYEARLYLLPSIRCCH